MKKILHGFLFLFGLVVISAAPLEEVRTELQDASNALVAKFYLAAISDSDTEITTKGGAYNTSNILYTLEEVLEDRGLYINMISMNHYIAKPIRIYLKATPNEVYTFRWAIRRGRDSTVQTLYYYLEDSLTGTIAEMSAGQSYTFTATADDTSRFRIYYRGYPNMKGVYVEGPVSMQGINSIPTTGTNQTSLVVKNGGELKVHGPLLMPVGAYEVQNGGTFQLVYSDASATAQYDAYGQLYQSAASIKNKNVGTLVMQTNVPASRGLSSKYVEIAMPFIGETLASVMNNSFGSNVADTGNRYTQYAWVWDNEKALPDHLISANVDPTKVYTFNFSTNSTMASIIGKVVNDTSFFKGVANAGKDTLTLSRQLYSKISDVGATYLDELALGSAQNYMNEYSEPYVSYLFDPSSAKNQADFGRNVYYIANPYPTNLSVTKLFELAKLTTDDIKALAYTTNQSGTVGSTQYAEFYVATCTKGALTISADNCSGSLFSAGSPVGSDLLLRPMGTLAVKLEEGVLGATPTESTPINLIYSEDTKVYTYAGLIDQRKGKGTTVSGVRPLSVKTGSVSNQQNRSIEELEIVLQTAGESLANAFLVADPHADDEVTNKMDAAANEYSPLSVMTEKTNGHKLYINGISMDHYTAKPVQLNLKTQAGKAYTLDTYIRVGSDRTIAKSEFYLEDRKMNKIMSINAAFSYNFTASTNDTNRFAVYYGGFPNQDNKVIASASDIQLVKQGEQDVVVFKAVEGIAKVYVYDVLGRLVLVDEKVDPSQHFVLEGLPKGAGVYLVKILTQEATVTKKMVR